MINTLICTVGTSLIENNLKRMDDFYKDIIREHPMIKEYYKKNNWYKLGIELSKLSPKERICGAEINTIEESTNKKWIELENLFFFLSDTELGKNTGIILKSYYEQRKDLKIKNIETIQIKDLTDENPKSFKLKGLRNLIKEAGKIIGRIGVKNISIDATGGYKAQIAIAVLIGQALNIPVYYKHEKFSEIIDFPPLPISLDYDILGKNFDLFHYFETGEIIPETEINNIDEKLLVFLDSEKIDENVFYELNPIGQLYIESFRFRTVNKINLKDLEDKERKEPTFGKGHHYPNGFKDFVKKLWEKNKWIKTCNTLPYNKQQSIQRTGFKVVEYNNSPILLGQYKGNDFGAVFRILLSEESKDNLNWAADILNQYLDYNE